MNPAERHRWERTRSGGLWRFLLLRGMLVWGVGCGVLWTLVVTAVQDGLTATSLTVGGFGTRLIIAMAVFPFVGALWALRKWHVMESRYRGD